MKNITEYSIDELKDIIDNQSERFTTEEINQIKKRYNSLLTQIGHSQYKFYSKKELLRELARLNLCEKSVLTSEQVEMFKGKPDCYVEQNKYLCKLDDTINTRLLLAIFNSLRFIQNVIIASIICSILGIVFSIIIK